MPRGNRLVIFRTGHLSLDAIHAKHVELRGRAGTRADAVPTGKAMNCRCAASAIQLLYNLETSRSANFTTSLSIGSPYIANMASYTLIT